MNNELFDPGIDNLPMPVDGIEKENIIDRDALQDNMINQILDDMDIKTMMAILYDNMSESYDKYSVDELIAEVEEHYPHLLENWIMKKTTITLTHDQWDIVLDAIEDWAVLASEDQAENAGEILDIIESNLWGEGPSEVSESKVQELDAWSFD